MSAARREGVFRYIRHEDLDAYLAAGWIFSAWLAAPHGHYSVLVRACACNSEGAAP